MHNQLFVQFTSSANGSSRSITFGINVVGDRTEALDVIYVPGAKHDAGSRVKCTNGEVDQVSETNATVLHKPTWSWGAVSGSNEHGVVIGCGGAETLRSRSDEDPGKEKLLDTDVVRLALERGTSASDAVKVITGFLNEYKVISYRSSRPDSRSSTENVSSCFVIVDKSEAWIIEMAENVWAAERLTSGSRVLSGVLTIGKKYDACSEHLKSGEGIDFAANYGCATTTANVNSLVEEFNKQLNLTDAMTTQDTLKLVRDMSLNIPSGQCVVSSHVSQVSSEPNVVACHWLTATHDPLRSLFKPFIFTRDASVGDRTVSSTADASCSASCSGGRAALWWAHQSFLTRLEEGNSKSLMTMDLMQQLELNCLQDISDLISELASSADPSAIYPRVASLFQHIVNLEMNFYK